VLGACASEPDAVVRVRRQAADRITVQLCEDTNDDVCAAIDELFLDGEPTAVEHTVGIYLDQPAAMLTLRFQTFASPNFCSYVTVPFTGERRELAVTLPETVSDPAVAGCDDCTAGVCP